MLHHLRSKRGEGLLEAMIAIAILVTAVLGGVALITRQLATSRDRVRETLASGYAREALEYFDAVRLTNIGAGRMWVSGLEPGVYVLKTVQGAPPQSTRLVPGAGQDSRIEDATMPVFRRLINVQGACADGLYDKLYPESCPDGFTSVRVSVDVAWNSSGGMPRNTVLTRDFYAL